MPGQTPRPREPPPNAVTYELLRRASVVLGDDVFSHRDDSALSTSLGRKGVAVVKYCQRHTVVSIVQYYYRSALEQPSQSWERPAVSTIGERHPLLRRHTTTAVARAS